MKKIYLTLLALFTTGLACYAQLNVQDSWLVFPSGNGPTFIRENWGLNISGSNVQPVKVINTSFMVGYFSANQDYGVGNALISGSVGIGTNSPTNKLTVNAGENNKSIEITGNNFFQSPATHYFPGLSFYSTQSAVRQPNASSEIVFSDRPGTAGYAENARTSDILFFTSHSYDGPSNAYGVFPDLTMTVRSTQDGGSVGIGTATPDPAYKLSVNGNIRTKEVKVEAGWADYVFKKNYQLKTLPEVEVYIQKNQHLPDVPSEADVKKSGVNVGETESLLLKKIEELTLYLIEKDKELKGQSSVVNKQSEQISLQSLKNRELEQRLQKLEGLMSKKPLTRD